MNTSCFPTKSRLVRRLHVVVNYLVDYSAVIRKLVAAVLIIARSGEILHAGVQQAGMVSAVQLRDVRDQFPVGVVCRQFLVRALSDDPISAETSRVVSTTSSLDGRAEHHWSGVAAVQLRSVDVRRRADSCIPRTTHSRMPGASVTSAPTVTIPVICSRPETHLFALQALLSLTAFNRVVPGK